MGRDLSGAWSGVYSYGFLGSEQPFSAELEDRAGALEGRIEEVIRSGPALAASLVGAREGSRVSFRKTYDGRGGWTHAVDYSGRLSEDGNEIAGRWRLAGASGTFLMLRTVPEPEPAVASAAVEEQAR